MHGHDKPDDTKSLAVPAHVLAGVRLHPLLTRLFVVYPSDMPGGVRTDDADGHQNVQQIHLREEGGEDVL